MILQVKENDWFRGVIVHVQSVWFRAEEGVELLERRYEKPDLLCHSKLLKGWGESEVELVRISSNDTGQR